MIDTDFERQIELATADHNLQREMTTQEKLQLIRNADFVKAQTTAIAPINRPKTYHDNFCTTYYFHQSVLSMSEEQQAEQPWIEHIVWVAEHLLGEPDIVEGRFGACRYPIRCLNDLHLFMRNFGYTYLPEMM